MMKRTHLFVRSLVPCSMLAAASLALADIDVPSVIGENMVLQQKQKNTIWGWGTAGETVTVSIDRQSTKTTVDDEGRWSVSLEPMDAGGPHRLTIAGRNRLVFDNVLVGEVWVCSGQSNMQWSVSISNDPVLEAKAANYPNIRLISVPQVAAETPQRDFQGEWKTCTPQTVSDFSAVGYYFGRQLHQTLNVPIGLIDNAWGGSACEAWVNRDVMESDDRYAALMEHWKGVEERYQSGEARKAFEKQLADWEAKAKDAKDKGEEFTQRKPRYNDGIMRGNQRPANLYNGVLHPVIGYGIRGAIWYQGESNASRAYQYRHLFPTMIRNWRAEWGQGDFPFYWVQLADFRAEKDEPAPSDWAELREAQTLTMDQLPHTGEAVIIDLGEANDIHPRNKQDVGKRLARWALARDYGHDDLAYRSPRYDAIEVKNGHVIIKVKDVGSGLDTFDVNEPLGFTIAGQDQVFHHAKAELMGKGAERNQIKVWSDAVSSPVAVRYAWADNPVCNVRSADGLPLTPFRTDDWPGVTAGKDSR